MIRLQLTDYATGAGRARQTTGGTFIISGARLDELQDGLPHIRIEPRILKGLTIVDYNPVGSFAETSAISVKLKEINSVTQGLQFVADTTSGKTHESFLELRTGPGLEINQSSGEVKVNVDGTSITTNAAGQITLVSTADFLSVNGSFGTDGKLYLTFVGDIDTKSFRYKVSTTGQPTLAETVTETVVAVDANGNTITLNGPYSPGTVVYVTALAYTATGGGGIQTGPFKYQFTRGALTYTRCDIKLIEPVSPSEVEFEVTAVGPGTGTVKLVEVIGNTSLKSGYPAVNTSSASGTRWKFNRGTPLAGLGQVRFRAEIPNSEPDEDLATVPEQGRDTVPLASRARVIESTSTSVTVRYAVADKYTDETPSVSLSYQAYGVGTITRLDNVTHTAAAAGTVTPSATLTTPEAAGSYVDFVIPRPATNAGTGRVVFTATANNRVQDSDAVEVTEQLPDMASVVGSFDASGQLYLAINASAGVASIKYLVSTTSQPTFAQVDAATGANVQNSRTYSTILPGPYTPGTTVYISVVTYTAADGAGKKSPVFTYQFVRGAVVYNQCRIEIVETLTSTIRVKVYADSLLPNAKVKLVATTGSAVVAAGTAAGTEVASGSEWTFTRGAAFGGGGQAQFRATVTGAESDDDYVTIPEQGRDTVYLVSRARVTNSTDSTVTVRYAVADPYPQGNDTVTVTYTTTGITGTVAPDSGGTVTPKAVLEESTTGGKSTYIEYTIPRPAAGQPTGQIVFTAAANANNRIVDKDSVFITPVGSAMVAISGSFNQAGNLVFTITAPAGTGSFRYAYGTTAPLQTAVEAATIQAGNTLTVTTTETYTIGTTVHVAVITYPEASAGGTASAVFRTQHVRSGVIYNQCRIEVLAPPQADQVAVRVYADSIISGTGTVQLVQLTGPATKVSGANAGVATNSPADWVFTRGAVGGADGFAQFRASLSGGQSDDDFVTIPAIGRDTVYLSTRCRVTETLADTVKVRVAVNDPYSAIAASITYVENGTGGVNLTNPQSVTTGVGSFADNEPANTYKDYIITRPAFGTGTGRVVFTATATGRILDMDSVDIPAKEKTSFGPSLVVKETIAALKYTLVATFDGSLTYQTDGGADSAAITSSPFSLDVFRNTPYGNPKNVTFKCIKDGQTVTNTVSVPAQDSTTGGGTYTFPNDVSVNGKVYAQDFILTAGTGGGISGLTLDSLEDVQITGATDGQIIKRVGGIWTNVAASAGGGSITVLDESTQLTTAATSLAFVGSGVSATNNNGAVTISITGNVSAFGGATGAITLGNNLTMSGNQLQLSNVLTTSTAYLAAPTGTGAREFAISITGDNGIAVGRTGPSYTNSSVTWLGGDRNYIYYNASSPLRIGSSGGYLELNGNEFNTTNYRQINDYSSNSTWYIRTSSPIFVWGTAHDWTQSFSLNLGDGSAGANTGWATFGQRQSNSAAGTWKGVRIMQYTASAATDGYLRAARYYLGDDTNYLTVSTSGSLRSQTASGYLDMGAQNSSYAHFYTDRPRFYFGSSVTVNGDIQRYSDGAVYIHTANLSSSLSGTYNISITGNAATVTNGIYTTNIGSYAPSLTGSGASGTWGISISGNAATVTNGMYLSGDQNISGAKAFTSPQSTFTSQSGNQGLTVYSGNGVSTDAYMTFHVGGDWAAYFGLGGVENDFVVGGWSMGANRYRVLHTGNYTSYVAAASTTLTINGTAGEVEVSGGSQSLAANRTWTIGLPDAVTITTSLDIGSVSSLAAATLRVGGNVRVGGTIYANDFVLTGGTGSPTGLYLDTLDDVVIGTASGGVTTAVNQVLQWDGGNWRNSFLRMEEIGNVSLTSPTTNQVLTYNGSAWVNAAPAGAVSSVYGRTGAVVAAEGDYTLTLLGDVTITSPSNSQVLQYNGTTWVNATIATGGVTSFGSATGAITLGSNLTMSGTQLQLSNVITTSNIGNQSVNYATSAGSATSATSASSASSVAASGITGQTGMWTSAARPGASRLYRNDSDSDYSVQTYWTGTRWRLYGYNGGTAHADTHVGYADAVSSISSGQVTTALGYTPYNSTNPNGYTSNTGTVTSVSGTGTVSGLSLSGTVTGSGSLTLSGTLSLTSGQVTTALGFTPYNSTNPSGYITGITSAMVTTALGFTPYNSTNPSGYITASSTNTLSNKTAYDTNYKIAGTRVETYAPSSQGADVGAIWIVYS